MRGFMVAVMALLVAGPAVAEVQTVGIARDAGRLVGMASVCGGEAQAMAERFVGTINVFLNSVVYGPFRQEAVQAFNDGKELAAATQSAGRGLDCGEVRVLLRQADRNIKSAFPTAYR